jgi:hypothetical protein
MNRSSDTLIHKKAPLTGNAGIVKKIHIHMTHTELEMLSLICC